MTRKVIWALWRPTPALPRRPCSRQLPSLCVQSSSEYHPKDLALVLIKDMLVFANTTVAFTCGFPGFSASSFLGTQHSLVLLDSSRTSPANALIY